MPVFPVHYKQGTVAYSTFFGAESSLVLNPSSNEESHPTNGSSSSAQSLLIKRVSV